MRGTELRDDTPAVTRRFTSRLQPRLVLGVALLTALISMAICAAAILEHAPTAVVPVVVAVGVGAPLFAAWEAPIALAWIRADRAERSHRKALSRLRSALDRLPEVEHPLGD
jgi:hypothetical protein